MPHIQNEKLKRELQEHNKEHGPRDLTPGDVEAKHIIATLFLAGGAIFVGYVAANPDFLSKLIGN